MDVQLKKRLEEAIRETEKVVSSAVTIDRENKSVTINLKVDPDEKLTADEIETIKKFVAGTMEEPSAYDILVNAE